MSRLPDVLYDVPSTRKYLTLVEESLDKPTFQHFIAELQVWIKVQGSQDRHHSTTSLLQTVSILRRHPSLMHGFNTLLRPNLRIRCSTACKEVKFFVIAEGPNATIYSTSCTDVPIPSTTEDLRRYVDKDSWNKLRGPSPDQDWLTCISQLLLVIVDHPSNPTIGRRAYRCLRELSAMSILPPSVFINVPQRAALPIPQDGGAFADIYSGKLCGTPVCYRVLRMFETNVDDRQRFFKQFCSELGVWRQLNHPNILPLIGATLELFAPRFCFISPWLAHGNIMAYLKRNPGHDRFTSVCDIVNAIEYLHGLDPPVTHKDIKGANVLVRDDLVCCLADFGLSSIVESQRLSVSTSPAFAGSVCWLAPELMDPKLVPVKNERAGDIYALACTIYEIYTGMPPFSGPDMNHLAVMFAVLKEERPTLPPPHPDNRSWSEEEMGLWWLVGLCWKQNPEDRPKMRLIKDTLQDIGVRTPRVTSPLPMWKNEARDGAHPGNMPDLREVGSWLEDRLSKMGVSSSKQSDDSSSPLSRDLHTNSSHRTIVTMRYAKAKDEKVPHSTLGESRMNILQLSLSTPRKPRANPLGLRTPDTPSHPVCDADLPEVSDAEFMGSTPHDPFISEDSDRALDSRSLRVEIPDDLNSYQAPVAYTRSVSSSSRLVVNTRISDSLPTPPSTPSPRSLRQCHPAALWHHASPSASAHRLQFGTISAEEKAPASVFLLPRIPKIPQAVTSPVYAPSPLRHGAGTMGTLPFSSAPRDSEHTQRGIAPLARTSYDRL